MSDAGVLAASLAALAGVLLGLVFVRFVRRLGAERVRRFYAVGLAVASLLYVLFALLGAPSLVPRELAGLVLFGLVALVGARRWPVLLGLGWAVHVAWDVALHPAGAADGVPGWYPPLCIGFDLVLAAALLTRRAMPGPPSAERADRSALDAQRST